MIVGSPDKNDELRLHGFKTPGKFLGDMHLVSWNDRADAISYFKIEDSEKAFIRVVPCR
jgi:hypothetical protein